MAEELMKDVTVAAIGPITADTAKEMGFKVTISAESFTIPGLCDAILQHYVRILKLQSFYPNFSISFAQNLLRFHHSFTCLTILPNQNTNLYINSAETVHP